MSARPQGRHGDSGAAILQVSCKYIRNIMSGVTALKFTKFLHDIASSSPALIPLCRWQYCIPFQNASAKTGGSQIQRLQKAPKLIGYPNNVP